MIPVESYAGRRVAVFGLGRTGIATAQALEAGGATVSCWDDLEPARHQAETVGLTLDDLNRRDWGDIAALVLSPGIPLTHPKPHHVVELARAVDAPIVSDIELFAQTMAGLPEKRQPKIIGITGTNGKSTTTALVGHILERAGHNVHVGGNIGDAILTLQPPKPGTVYVLELSSYQIDLTQSLDCDIAVLLNLSPDHLDRHGGYEGYKAAKARLFSMQGAGQAAIVGVDDADTAAFYTHLRNERRIGVVIPISSGRVVADGVYAVDEVLHDARTVPMVQLADLRQAPALPGRHNAQNAAAAAAIARVMGVSARVIEDAVASFPGLAHRQEMVATIGKVRFVNDSKATNADAALQALGCYEAIHWIAGGRAKEDGLSAIAPVTGNIRQAYLVGESAKNFARELRGDVPFEICETIDVAVKKARMNAEASADDAPVVLLSPAAASFDQYQSFEARGDAFKAIVGRLAESHGAVA